MSLYNSNQFKTRVVQQIKAYHVSSADQKSVVKLRKLIKIVYFLFFIEMDVGSYPNKRTFSMRVLGAFLGRSFDNPQCFSMQGPELVGLLCCYNRLGTRN